MKISTLTSSAGNVASLVHVEIRFRRETDGLSNNGQTALEYMETAHLHVRCSASNIKKVAVEKVD